MLPKPGKGSLMVCTQFRCPLFLDTVVIRGKMSGRPVLLRYRGGSHIVLVDTIRRWTCDYILQEEEEAGKPSGEIVGRVHI